MRFANTSTAIYLRSQRRGGVYPRLKRRIQKRTAEYRITNVESSSGGSAAGGSKCGIALSLRSQFGEVDALSPIEKVMRTERVAVSIARVLLFSAIVAQSSLLSPR